MMFKCFAGTVLMNVSVMKVRISLFTCKIASMFSPGLARSASLLQRSTYVAVCPLTCMPLAKDLALKKCSQYRKALA